MNRLICLIFLQLCLVITGCSTFERYTYYSPDVKSSQTTGPIKPICGMVSFSAPADKYNNSVEGSVFKIESSQNFQPYLWGPWLVTIVPIFPFTWISEPFRNPDIEFVMFVDKKISDSMITDIRLVLGAETDKEINPSNTQKSASTTTFKFPVKFKDQDRVQLKMKLQGKEVVIPFKKASRWAWTQWSPNC